MSLENEKYDDQINDNDSAEKVNFLIKKGGAKTEEEAEQILKENYDIFQKIDKEEKDFQEQEKTGDWWAKKTKNELLEETRLRTARTMINAPKDSYDKVFSEKQKEVEREAKEKIIKTVEKIIDVVNKKYQEEDLTAINLDPALTKQIQEKTGNTEQRKSGKSEMIFSGGLAIALNFASRENRKLSVDDFKRVSGDIDLEVANQDFELTAKMFAKEFIVNAGSGHVVDVQDKTDGKNILDHDSWHIGLVKDLRGFRNETQTTQKIKLGGQETIADTPEYIYLIKNAQGRTKDLEDLDYIKPLVDPQKYQELKNQYQDYIEKKRSEFSGWAKDIISKNLEEFFTKFDISDQNAIGQVENMEFLKFVENDTTQKEIVEKIQKAIENNSETNKNKMENLIMVDISDDINELVQKKLEFEFGNPKDL